MECKTCRSKPQTCGTCRGNKQITQGPSASIWDIFTSSPGTIKGITKDCPHCKGTGKCPENSR